MNYFRAKVCVTLIFISIYFVANKIKVLVSAFCWFLFIHFCEFTTLIYHQLSDSNFRIARHTV